MGNALSCRSDTQDQLHDPAQDRLHDPAQDQLHGSPLRAPVLTEETAWKIAMTWREQLHTHVSLCTDPLHCNLQDDNFVFVKSYEWISFSLPEDQVPIARAATIVWFWLSCCAGYSGRENPRFWKRVFSELMRPHPMTARQKAKEKKEEEKRMRYVYDAPLSVKQKDYSITDAIRFFDHPDRPFPRATLKFGRASLYKVFMGLEQPSPQGSKLDKKLQALFLQLQPFICADRLQRPVQVTLDKELSHAEMDELTKVSPLPPSLANGVMVPRFFLSSVIAWLFVLSPSVEEQKARLCHEMVHAQWDTCVDDKVPEAQRATRLLSMFGVDKTTSLLGSIDTLKVTQSDLSPKDLTTICSLLPHSQSVRTFRYRPSNGPSWKSSRLRQFDLMDWAWLGYALFHPDTESSMWCNLDIYFEDVTSTGVQILQLMATGNHLTSVENNILTPTTSFYHTATLCEHINIYTEPNDEAVVVFTMEEFTQVCLCVDDPSTLGTWVRVVAPGLGFGWILSSSIHETASRPPGKPSIQALRVCGSWTTDAIVSFVSVVGGELKTLDLGNGKPFNAEQLSLMLARCLALTSLRVIHDGSLWQMEEILTQSELPPLEQLSLIVPDKYYVPSPEAVDSSLRNLLVLRVIARSGAYHFQQSEPQVVAFLENHPRLQYFHWSDGRCRETNCLQPNGMLPYLEGRQRTHKYLEKLSTRALSSCCAPFSVECKLAFLSVRSSTRDGTECTSVTALSAALGRIDQEIAVQIFAFAASLAPRELWVGGN